MKIAILCIGNRLMLDDGVGPAVYDALEAGYRFGDDVALYDAGCMTMDLLPHVCKADFVIVVDAVDGTGEQPGTVFRFAPGDIAGHGVMQSLHEAGMEPVNAMEQFFEEYYGNDFMADRFQSMTIDPSRSTRVTPVELGQ